MACLANNLKLLILLNNINDMDLLLLDILWESNGIERIVLVLLQLSHWISDSLIRRILRETWGFLLVTHFPALLLRRSSLTVIASLQVRVLLLVLIDSIYHNVSLFGSVLEGMHHLLRSHFDWLVLDFLAIDLALVSFRKSALLHHAILGAVLLGWTGLSLVFVGVLWRYLSNRFLLDLHWLFSLKLLVWIDFLHFFVLFNNCLVKLLCLFFLLFEISL